MKPKPTPPITSVSVKTKTGTLTVFSPDEDNEVHIMYGDGKESIWLKEKEFEKLKDFINKINFR